MSDDKECNFKQKEKIKIITNFFLQVAIKAVKILIIGHHNRRRKIRKKSGKYQELFRKNQEKIRKVKKWGIGLYFNT